MRVSTREKCVQNVTEHIPMSLYYIIKIKNTMIFFSNRMSYLQPIQACCSVSRLCLEVLIWDDTTSCLSYWEWEKSWGCPLLFVQTERRVGRYCSSDKQWWRVQREHSCCRLHSHLRQQVRQHCTRVWRQPAPQFGVQGCANESQHSRFCVYRPW